ncbi:hypothetical protein HMPREF1572_00362 [Gardnerella vaginalis JCP7275]|nr:hypothetical protein HMPREF1572_00362 [Gardnerella vaginalis JCP7275]
MWRKCLAHKTTLSVLLYSFDTHLCNYTKTQHNCKIRTFAIAIVQQESQ